MRLDRVALGAASVDARLRERAARVFVQYSVDFDLADAHVRNIVEPLRQNLQQVSHCNVELFWAIASGLIGIKVTSSSAIPSFLRAPPPSACVACVAVESAVGSAPEGSLRISYVHAPVPHAPSLQAARGRSRRRREPAPTRLRAGVGKTPWRCGPSDREPEHRPRRVRDAFSGA